MLSTFSVDNTVNQSEYWGFARVNKKERISYLLMVCIGRFIL